MNNRLRYHRMTELEAFEDSFIPEPNSGCWLWLGAIFEKRGGYGIFNFGKSLMQRAHRVAWRLYRDPWLNSKTHILHSCDNPCCVNPDHLFEGNQVSNMFDMSMKGRQAHSYKSARYKHGRYVGDKQNPNYKHPLNDCT